MTHELTSPGDASPPARSDLHITVTGLTKRFRDRTILDHISFAVAPGQTVALIGPSGGGKSTLLRCLNGLHTFEAGEIQIGPHRLTAAEDRGDHEGGEDRGARGRHHRRAPRVRLASATIRQTGTIARTAAASIRPWSVGGSSVSDASPSGNVYQRSSYT